MNFTIKGLISSLSPVVLTIGTERRVGSGLDSCGWNEEKEDEAFCPERIKDSLAKRPQS